MTKPRHDREASSEPQAGPDEETCRADLTDDAQDEALSAPDEIQAEIQAETKTGAAAPTPADGGQPVGEDAVESPEEILRRERDTFQEKWLRLVAELDNVRKRSRRELLESRRFAQADVLRSFLVVMDNFERALQSPLTTNDNQQSDGFRAGVELIYQNFQSLLKDLGVKPIEALDKAFDPNVHEAVGQLDREGAASGQVIEVVQQGYEFQDLVLRPARVIIAE